MHNKLLTVVLSAKIQRYSEYFNLLVYAVATVFLIALEQDTIGLIFLCIGVVSLYGCSLPFRKNMLLIYLCLLVLHIIPIGTTTKPPDALFMGLGLATVVLLPLWVTRKIYQHDFIQLPSLRDKNWTSRRTLYLFITALLAYLILPVMLRDTNSYPNWSFSPNFWGNLEAYIGLNIVGIWDELFFVCTVLAILQRFFPFAVANIAQAILFTAFLYALAFKGWSVLVIFPFALLQGYIFRQTKSLLFILAIHLTVDLVLHLAIARLNHPHLFPYFLT